MSSCATTQLGFIYIYINVKVYTFKERVIARGEETHGQSQSQRAIVLLVLLAARWMTTGRLYIPYNPICCACTSDFRFICYFSFSSSPYFPSDFFFLLSALASSVWHNSNGGCLSSLAQTIGQTASSSIFV